MPREKDTRDFTRITRGTTDLEKTLSSSFSETLPGTQRVEVKRLNPLTGTPRQLDVVNAPPSEGSLVQRRWLM